MKPAVLGQVAGGEAGHDVGGERREARARHAERGEDTAVQEFAERHPRRALHRQAEQEEAGVAVQEPAARREIQPALAPDHRQQVGAAAGAGQVEPTEAHQFQHVPDAGGVAHQLVERDARAKPREFRNDGGDVVIRREQPVLRQQQHGRAGELLRHRGDAEDGGGIDAHAVLDAGKPCAAVQHQRAVAHQADGAAGRCRPGEGREQRIDAPFEHEEVEVARRHAARACPCGCHGTSGGLPAPRRGV